MSVQKKPRFAGIHWLKWPGNVHVTKDFIFLLLIGGLYSLSVALSNTFVNVYLWKQTNEFFLLGLYNLMIVISQPVTFMIAGKISKIMDRIIVLRAGVVFLSIFYICVLMTGDRAADYLLLLGALLGVGYGFYWLAYNVLTFEITEPGNRDFFNGFLGILTSVGGMIGPMTAGFIISRMENFTGYTVIFSLSLGLFALSSVLSFFMKRRSAEGDYLFLNILKKRNENINWKRITNANYFQGLREGIFAFVINVYVFISTGSEMALGTFAFVNSFISFLTYFLAARHISKKRRKSSIFIGGLLLSLSILIIILKVNFPLFLIYSAVIAFSYPLVLVPFSSTTYDVIGVMKDGGSRRIEYIVVRELFLNLGRMTSIIVFLLSISFFTAEKVIPVLLMVFGSGYLLIYFFVRKMDFS